MLSDAVYYNNAKKLKRNIENKNKKEMVLFMFC